MSVFDGLDSNRLEQWKRQCMSTNRMDEIEELRGDFIELVNRVTDLGEKLEELGVSASPYAKLVRAMSQAGEHLLEIREIAAEKEPTHVGD